MGYPKAPGQVESGSDGNIMRQGTGGRLALDPMDHDNNADVDWRNDYRRNEVGLDLLPGENS